MTEVNLIQETAPFTEALPHLPESKPPKLNHHSELSSLSQSLRALNSDRFAFYYETIEQAMQSTSTSDSKACKKRDSTGSIRHGFIAKKNLNKKQCNGIIPVVQQQSQAAQRILCPGAPRNTTSFLINDMEERQSRDVSPPTPSVSPSSRVRCSSTSAVEATTSECPIARILPVEEELEEPFSVNDDFYSDYNDMVEQLCSERLNSISRDQINKQFLHLEEHNRDLINHFTRLREENDNLKQLLRANNIDIPQASS